MKGNRVLLKASFILLDIYADIYYIPILKGIRLVLVLMLLRMYRFTINSIGTRSQVNFTDAPAFIGFKN